MRNVAVHFNLTFVMKRMQRGTLLYILLCYNYDEKDAARNVAVHFNLS